MVKCTNCILDGTDACTRGAGRAVDDTICDKYMSENECLNCLFSTRKEKIDEAYQKGRADVIDELSSIENFCDTCYMEFCESCKHNGEYAYEIQKKLEQLKGAEE